jgi:flagellar motor switch protein FliG
MKMIPFRVILLSLALTFAVSLNFYVKAATQSTVEGKIALENSLQKRVQMVISEALGTDNIIVIINAELNEKKQETNALDFLPGVPQKEKVGEMNFTNSLTMVKKITATIILDKTTSKEDIKLVKKLAGGLLGLPADRQDLISIEKMSFKKDKPFTLQDMLTPPNLWNLIWIVLIAIFATAVVTIFLSPISKTAKRMAELFADSKSNDSDAGARPLEALKASVEEDKQTQAVDIISAEEGKKKPFWFVTESNISNLIFILKSKSVEELTIVLNYIPNNLSSKLVEALYPNSIQALKNLPKVILLPEDEVRKLEAEILNKLEYVVGGEDKTLNIIETLQEKIQEKAISTFTLANPLFFKKIKAQIVRFSDIKNLEPAHAQFLARRVPMRNLAAALKTSDISAGFVIKLSGGMQERLQQELELTRNMTAEAAKEERMIVIKALKQLVKEGFITLNKTTARPSFAKRPIPGKPAGTKPSFSAGQAKTVGAPGATPNLKPRPGVQLKPTGMPPKTNPAVKPALSPKPGNTAQTANLNAQQKKV